MSATTPAPDSSVSTSETTTPPTSSSTDMPTKTPPTSYARSIFLSRHLKRLKRAFKCLFQLACEVYYEEQLATQQITTKPSFYDDLTIPLGYFNQQIKEYIKQRKENNLPCEFYVIQSDANTREVVRILDQGYFFQDPKTEISWSAFKEFFYRYDSRYKSEVEALKKEIDIFEKIQKLFRKLSSKGSLLNYAELQRVFTKARIFSPESSFWKLDCWQPTFAQQTVDEVSFTENYLQKQTVENLKNILDTLQSGIKPDLGRRKIS